MDTVLRDERANISVTPRETEQARTVSTFLSGANQPTSTTTVVVDSGSGQLPLPPELTAVVLELVDLVGRGCAVSVGSIPNEVTTTVAARMLNMSRPSLMKLVRDHQLPAHKVGSHTRLFSQDVLTYRRARLEEQSAAFDELRAIEEEWDVRD